MPELLTESFCERCGTRFTFESQEPQTARAGNVRRARILARGLKNYVMQDELPLSAAMADARRDEERVQASQQLEAFHQAFNFCMTCRQYTCLNCWNEAEGRCLSCAPLPETAASEVAASVVAASEVAARMPAREEPPTAENDVLSPDEAPIAPPPVAA
jgi:hypothetical protein